MFGIYTTTMIINLKKTEDELWSQIGLRTDVRKGIKNNIDIIFEPSEKETREAYELYLIMMKKKYIPVEKKYSLGNTKKTKIIIAKKDGKVISYIQFQLFSGTDILLKSKMCALETIASDYNYTKFAPNTLLYWEGIKYMKSLGFEYLNFNGVSYQFAEKDFHNLAKYKRKWGGIEIQQFSRKTFLGYVYWRFFRKYTFIKKTVYFLLTNLFKNKFIKY